jgi:hypothetical protein
MRGSSAKKLRKLVYGGDERIPPYIKRRAYKLAKKRYKNGSDTPE